MSPVKMLHSWGNSSRLLLRKSGPIGVRCAVGLASKWVATSGVPVRMLLNFGMLKILLLRPTRSDQYRIGPAEVTRTSSASIIRGMDRTSTKKTASPKSNKRFKNHLGALSKILLRGKKWGASIVAFPMENTHTFKSIRDLNCVVMPFSYPSLILACTHLANRQQSAHFLDFRVVAGGPI